jgi:hypothetical protein
VPLPLTKSQIERLGRRLVEVSEPAAADIASLHEVLRAYALTLEAAGQRLRDATGLRPTARIKNTGTILEKLRRHRGSGLKSIQDLAGMRVVGAFDRRGQDELVREVVCLFNDAPRSPKVIDRRARPVNGYAIARFEEAEHARPEAPQLAQFRQEVASGLAALRALAEKFESFDVRAIWRLGSDG